MDPRQFDRLVQALPEVVSRRRALRGLGALTLDGMTIAPRDDVSARKKKKNRCKGVNAPDPCTSTRACGKSGAPNGTCYCVTSVDGVTTCTSVFVNFDRQTADCQSDADCAGYFGSGVEAVCVSSPCFGGGIQNWCVNQGCVDLNAHGRAAQADGKRVELRQLDLHSRA